MAERDPRIAARLLQRALSCCTSVLADLRLSPGGDCYTFEGSMNTVEDAKEAVDQFDAYMLATEKRSAR